MKDIVENRKRISFARKLRLATLALRENGLWWCTLLLMYYAASTVANRGFATLDRHQLVYSDLITVIRKPVSAVVPIIRSQ